jgi:hypothetical protein
VIDDGVVEIDGEQIVSAASARDGATRKGWSGIQQDHNRHHAEHTIWLARA